MGRDIAGNFRSLAISDVPYACSLSAVYRKSTKFSRKIGRVCGLLRYSIQILLFFSLKFLYNVHLDWFLSKISYHFTAEWCKSGTISIKSLHIWNNRSRVNSNRSQTFFPQGAGIFVDHVTHKVISWDLEAEMTSFDSADLNSKYILCTDSLPITPPKCSSCP